MTPAEVATAHQGQLRATAMATVAAVLARWNMIDPDDIVGSWRELLPSVAALLTAGQLAAAERGAAYIPAVAAAQDVDAGDARPKTAALAGIASDGRPLDTLVSVPVARTLARIGEGQLATRALAQSHRTLGMLVATQVLDAGRTAASIGMVATPSLGGYRRQLTTPSCARCVILAGKWFRWNDGFQRHPRCDCVHVPSTGTMAERINVIDTPRNRGIGGDPGFDPRAYFDSLDAADQDRIFTKAGAEAIRDGADMNQVINARRGMRTTAAYGKQIKTTVTGTTKRASAARRMARELDAQFAKQGGRYTRINVPRLMPEQIYADATSREDAVRLLRRFGYL